jgi:hypothetical protein
MREWLIRYAFLVAGTFVGVFVVALCQAASDRRRS